MRSCSCSRCGWFRCPSAYAKYFFFNLYEDLNNARTSVEIIQVVVTRLRCRKVQNARSKQIVIEHLSLLRRCMLKVSVGGGKETSKEYQWRTRKYLSMSLCGGTDELWAGFKELYTAVENHNGRDVEEGAALRHRVFEVDRFDQHNRRRRRDVLLPGERSPVECGLHDDSHRRDSMDGDRAGRGRTSRYFGRFFRSGCGSTTRFRRI